MYDVVIVGGGLAGLASAGALARAGARVLLAEQRRYPFHRVCGEYLSHEVGPFLSQLGLRLLRLGATSIRHLQLTSPSGRALRCPLPASGYGLSRYRLDAELAAQALAAGVELREGMEVKHVEFRRDRFTLQLGRESIVARLVLGCHGKRSRLDRLLGRDCASRRSDYLAVKRHYFGPLPSDVVSLHAFPGGYCGVSRVEDDRINVCYLTDRQTLRRSGSLSALESEVLSSNPHLGATLRELTPAMDRLVVSQLDYARRSAVEHHMLMVGDAGGLTYPLCGNGMALALRSARLIARLVPPFLDGALTRQALERQFLRTWPRRAEQRRRLARALQPILRSPSLSNAACDIAQRATWLPTALVHLSHGQPI